MRIVICLLLLISSFSANAACICGASPSKGTPEYEAAFPYPVDLNIELAFGYIPAFYCTNSQSDTGTPQECAQLCIDALNTSFMSLAPFKPLGLVSDVDCTIRPGDANGGANGGDPIPMPCGYPGAQYLNCNVFDAAVEAEQKKTTAAVNNVKTSVDGVKTSVNDVKTAVGGVVTAVGQTTAAVNQVTAELKVQTAEMKTQTTEIKAQTVEAKTQTDEIKKIPVAVDKNTAQLTQVNTKLDTLDKTTKDGLQKLEDAALHKNVKVTIGSCVEAPLDKDKLPKLSGGLFSDTLLTGFNCTGDQAYCAQLEMQAQSYCRDVISQRLQVMHLNGANVFVKCPDDYVPTFDLVDKISNSPICKYKNSNCLVPGQSSSSILPRCTSPITVTCPSEDFIPVIIAGGFSCDTKLAAGKFNAQISIFQQFIDSLRDKMADEILVATKDATLKSSEGFANDFSRLHETFKDGYTNYSKLGLKGGSIPEGAADARSLLASVGPTIEFMGYTYKNDLAIYGQRAYDLLIRFVPNPLLVFTSSGNCSALTSVFQSVESGLSAIYRNQGGFNNIFATFSNSLCNTWLPLVRYFLGFFFAYWTTIYVYRSFVQILVITFGGHDTDVFILGYGGV